MSGTGSIPILFRFLKILLSRNILKVKNQIILDERYLSIRKSTYICVAS